MNNNTNTILKYAAIAGLVCIPFIPMYVADNLFFPFISGKGFAFRILVEFVFAIWLVLLLRERGTSIVGTDKSVAPRVNSITVTVTLFTIFALISDILGLNPIRSIWSNFERMEGWLTIVHLWAYFIVLSSIFGSGEVAKNNWNKFLNVVLFSGFITAVYGLWQFLGWAEIHQGSSRVDASLGNSAYMAVYMVLNAFIAGYAMLVDKKISIKRNIIGFLLSVFSLISLAGVTLVHASADPYVAGAKFLIILILLVLAISLFISPYSSLIVFFSFVMFQTATRGTILGWIAAILVSCFIYAVFGRESSGQSNKSRAMAGGAIALVIISGILFYVNRDAKWIRNNGVLGRLATISLSDTKTQARGFIWPMAIKGVFSSTKTAIIGVGQENFNYIFNVNYNPKMYKHEQWFDRAHSVFLDWLVAGGLIGLLSYLSLFVMILIYIFKSEKSVAEKSVLVGLVFAYGIHNVFVFDNQTSYVMFFTLLAYVHSFRKSKALSIGNVNEKITEDQVTVINFIYVPIIVIAFASVLYFVNVRAIQANTGIITILKACQTGKGLETKIFDSVFKMNQTVANQEAREQMLGCAAGVINGGDSIAKKEEFYNLVKKEVDKQIKDTPNDARIYIIAGNFYNAIRDYRTATPLLERAAILSPGKQSMIYDLVTNYVNIGKKDEAVALIEKAYLSAPDNENAKIAYITLLIANKQEAKAKELFGNQKELFEDPRVLNAYTITGNTSKAIEVYREKLLKNSEDSNLYSELASAYISDKNIPMAIKTLESAKEKFPLLKDRVDFLIKELQKEMSK